MVEKRKVFWEGGMERGGREGGREGETKSGSYERGVGIQGYLVKIPSFVYDNPILTSHFG